MKNRKVKCKIETSRGGVRWEWVVGTIIKEYPTDILVQLPKYKECFLLVDENDTWEVL